jgi:hypothetical protein
MYYVLCSSLGWCRYVCESDTAGAERNEHTISKSSARPNYAWYVSTWSYVAPENMSSTIYMHLRGSERSSRKHIGVMYVWYTLFLPMSPTNAPIYSSFLHHLGHRNTHHHTKPWWIGLKTSQTLALRGSHRGELLFG